VINLGLHLKDIGRPVGHFIGLSNRRFMIAVTDASRAKIGYSYFGIRMSSSNNEILGIIQIAFKEHTLSNANEAVFYCKWQGFWTLGKTTVFAYSQLPQQIQENAAVYWIKDTIRNILKSDMDKAQAQLNREQSAQNKITDEFTVPIQDSVETHRYLLMHGDDIIAESADDNFGEWKVYKQNRLPFGMVLRNISQAVALALQLEGYTETALANQTQENMQKIADIRAKVTYGIRNNNEARITNWLARRVLPLDRENAKLVYQYLGLEQLRTDSDKAKIAERFKAVSITDNYWLKKTTDIVSWDEVDVRRIPLSEGLGLIALVGESAVTLTSITDIIDNQAAADVSAIGSFPKGCFRRNGKLYIIKTDRGSKHTVIAEWLTARILSCTNVYGYCDYSLDDGTGKNGFPETKVLSVYCEAMSDTERDLVMANTILKTDPEELAVARFRKQFAQMAVIDYLIGNSDRHGGNWGFFREAPTWEITGLHDLYDHNKAFSMGVYYTQGGVKLPSVVGRGKPAAKNLIDGAMLFKDLAELAFIKPVDSKWFRKLGAEWERYLNEFVQRCGIIGLFPTII
jgi:hypothetical protein